ncbi:hypothetical protein EYF80_013317 [Liparis tanakae]|uniref:Uncharacterized protein n=1 Tax=Liparis tanakae TaxID=230148 RepID=A0A4Z2IGL6_9TELE|nr:hypothetical protein EYF80_013317 [Liparis tanakae]
MGVVTTTWHMPAPQPASISLNTDSPFLFREEKYSVTLRPRDDGEDFPKRPCVPVLGEVMPEEIRLTGLVQRALPALALCAHSSLSVLQAPQRQPRATGVKSVGTHVGTAAPNRTNSSQQVNTAVSMSSDVWDLQWGRRTKSQTGNQIPRRMNSLIVFNITCWPLHVRVTCSRSTCGPDAAASLTNSPFGQYLCQRVIIHLRPR